MLIQKGLHKMEKESISPAGFYNYSLDEFNPTVNLLKKLCAPPERMRSSRLPRSATKPLDGMYQNGKDKDFVTVPRIRKFDVRVS
jgi:hypothetical protein